MLKWIDRSLDAMMYVSIFTLLKLRLSATPGDSQVGGGFSPNFLCPGVGVLRNFLQF